MADATLKERVKEYTLKKMAIETSELDEREKRARKQEENMKLGEYLSEHYDEIDNIIVDDATNETATPEGKKKYRKAFKKLMEYGAYIVPATAYAEVMKDILKTSMKKSEDGEKIEFDKEKVYEDVTKYVMGDGSNDGPLAESIKNYVEGIAPNEKAKKAYIDLGEAWFEKSWKDKENNTAEELYISMLEGDSKAKTAVVKASELFIEESKKKEREDKKKKLYTPSF